MSTNKDLKIAVINFSGNVGKSTIATHVLEPRLSEPYLYSIESINTGGEDADENFKGKQFGEVQERMQIVDSAVVDIGSSNSEDFVRLMTQYRGSHEDYDFFVVPTVKDEKQQKDTIATIQALASIGVPAQKIRVVFNMVDISDSNLQALFPLIFAFYEREKLFELNTQAVIHSNEIFAKLKTTGLSINKVLQDDTDYKALIKAAKQEERAALAEKLSVKRLAAGVVVELDQVFAAVTS